MRGHRKNGEGIFYFIDGRVYKGNWSDDEMHGYGAEEGAYFYEGEWSRGVKHGKGYLRLKDNSTYHGNFADGRPHGSGIFKNDILTFEG